MAPTVSYVKSTIQTILTKTDHYLSSPNPTGNPDNIFAQFFQLRLFIKALPDESTPELLEILSQYPTFICRIADLINAVPEVMNKQAYCGLAFVIQTLMDKGAPTELFILSPNHPVKLALRNYLTQNQNSFFQMEPKDKTKFCTVWEVYSDLYPNDEQIVMLLENIGYYS